MFIKTLTVSDLNNYIKKTFDNDFILNNIQIKGEISNFKIHSSGHIYYSLKDGSGKINCIMFRSNAETLNFMPEEGMKVVAKGRVSVYEKEGAYQLYCSEMTQDGVGDLYVEFQKLKEKLLKEGLFDEKFKKAIPKYPRRIGVITSPTSAAVRDIINVAKRRNHKAQLLIYPSLVQGINAPNNLIEGINVLNQVEDIDIIILARGGGSIEELWAFNDEKLAYAIYNSKTPIVTGVGHETDFTIADFVGDFRAPTPSAAAEVAVGNIEDMNLQLLNIKSKLNNLMDKYIVGKYTQVDLLKKTLNLYSPQNYIVNQYNYIDNLRGKLKQEMKLKTSMEKEKLSKLYSLLSAHNPLNVLNKGYSIIQDENDSVIKNIKVLTEQSKVKITLSEGKINAKIEVLEEL